LHRGRCGGGFCAAVLTVLLVVKLHQKREELKILYFDVLFRAHLEIFTAIAKSASFVQSGRQ
jgi:hypothetical protein